MKWIRSCVAVLSIALFGCSSADRHTGSPAPATQGAGAPATGPAPMPDPAERQILGDVVQLTHNFDKAGEGYF